MKDPAHPLQDTDELLADFTDRLLKGEAKSPDPVSDQELFSLEQSVVQLHHAFPPAPLDDRLRRHLQADFTKRVRNAGFSSSSSPWWQRLRRPYLVVAFGVVAILLTVFLAPGFLTGTGQNIQGTASFPYTNIVLFVLLCGAFGYLVWLGRRK